MQNQGERLLGKIKAATFAIQRNKVDLPSLPGKFIERDRKVFRVISVNESTITLSDVKTPINQTTKMSIRSFLSKHIQEVTGK